MSAEPVPGSRCDEADERDPGACGHAWWPQRGPLPLGIAKFRAEEHRNGLKAKGAPSLSVLTSRAGGEVSQHRSCPWGCWSVGLCVPVERGMLCLRQQSLWEEPCRSIAVSFVTP